MGLGIVAIVAAVLWSLFWGLLALLASTFGGDTAGWVLVSGALAVGVLAFVLGISLIRGRKPGTLGWLVTGGVVAALFVLPVSSWSEDRAAAPVDRAVEQEYGKLEGVENVKADCSRLEDNPDGSESWICDVEANFDYDVCLADVTRSAGLVEAKVHGCSSDDLPER